MLTRLYGFIGLDIEGKFIGKGATKSVVLLSFYSKSFGFCLAYSVSL
jgi:hypothetical protein